LSREFNYRRANREWAEPRFKALAPHIRAVWDMVVTCADYLGQDSSLGVPFSSRVDEPGAHAAVKCLEEAFDACDPDMLAEAAVVINHCGHWGYTQAITVSYPGIPPKRFETDGDPFSPGREAKLHALELGEHVEYRAIQFEHERVCPDGDTAGAHWKFQKLVVTNLIRRGEWTHERNGKQVEKRLGFKTEDFMDHKEGTKYDLDEMPAIFRPHFNGTFEVVDARQVNHHPHPFVIGPKHFPRDGGMYIKPEQAPCADPRCALSLKSHTYDQVLIIKCLRDVPNKEAAEMLSSVKDLMAEHKLDGFAFMKSDFEILPPEEE
jgi:hypothetical protein